MSEDKRKVGKAKTFAEMEEQGELPEKRQVPKTQPIPRKIESGEKKNYKPDKEKGKGKGYKQRNKGWTYIRS